MNCIMDLASIDYFSASMHYSFIGFILGYLVGKLEVKLTSRFRGKRRKNG